MSIKNDLFKAMMQIYHTTKKETNYKPEQYKKHLLEADDPVSYAKHLINQEQGSYGYNELYTAGRLDLTVENLILDPKYMHLFSQNELVKSYDKLQKYGFASPHGDPRKYFNSNDDKITHPYFATGEQYSKNDIYTILNIPVEKRKGNWNTGYNVHDGSLFIFANVGDAGRTGHDYPNEFHNGLLKWYGKGNHSAHSAQMQNILSEVYEVLIFTRENSSDPYFTFQGIGKLYGHDNNTPVQINWLITRTVLDENCSNSTGALNPTKTYKEGTVKTITVNAYERNSKARKDCLDIHGYECKVCNFNFEERYGELGKEFIHVHHIKDISEIGEEYTVDPEHDLAPVCPNCHAMLHKTKPAMSIEQLKGYLRP